MAVGKDALLANTTADNNTAVGLHALKTNTTGSHNTAMGRDALEANTTGTENTAVGKASMEDNTTGSNNTAVGRQALNANTTASGNTGLGDNSLSACTTGANNTAVGEKSFEALTTGATNVAVGERAGYANTTASNNVFIGQETGLSTTTNSYNTIIGAHANTKSDNTSDEYQIALGYDTMSVGANYFTFGKGTGDDRVYNAFTSNASWTRVSDVRYKKEIQDNTDCGLDFINDLRPVTFKWKAKAELDPSFPDYDAEKTEADEPNRLYGLVAQEVKEALDKHNITDFGGWHCVTTGEHTQQGVSQEMFIHPLIKAIQELSAEVEELKQKAHDKCEE